jgi:hypothetical protein
MTNRGASSVMSADQIRDGAGESRGRVLSISVALASVEAFEIENR